MGKGKWREPGPTFSLVYATLLLQRQAQLGLNPALTPISGVPERGQRVAAVPKTRGIDVFECFQNFRELIFH